MNSHATAKCDFCRKRKVKCLRPDQQWNEVTREPKCQRCITSGRECGPDLKAIDSNETKRGENKRKAEQPVEDTAQRGTRTTNSSHVPKRDSTVSDNDAHGAIRRDASAPIHRSRPIASTEQPEPPQDVDQLFESCYELLRMYQQIKHPKKSMRLAVQDPTLSKDSKDRVVVDLDGEELADQVAERLELDISWVLKEIIRKVDETLDSAVCRLLLAQEALEKFRQLVGESEQLLHIELDALDKRIHVSQRTNKLREEQRETPYARGDERPFYQMSLETTRNAIVHRLQLMSRPTSPEAASTPSTDRSASSKFPIGQAGGLIYSKEKADLFAGSTDGHRSVLASQLLHSISPKSKNKNPFPALHHVLLFGTEQESQSWIMAAHGEARVQDLFKRRIAHIAAQKGRIHLLSATFLQKERKLLDTRDVYHLTPVLIAVMEGHLDSCKRLVEAGFDSSVRDLRGRNLLSLACKHGRFDIVKYLVNELGFPANDENHGRYICSPIHDAIEAGSPEICELLVDSGADLNHPNRFHGDKSPIQLALERGEIQIWKILNEKPRALKAEQAAAASSYESQRHVFNPQHNTINELGNIFSQYYNAGVQTQNSLPIIPDPSQQSTSQVPETYQPQPPWPWERP